MKKKENTYIRLPHHHHHRPAPPGNHLRQIPQPHARLALRPLPPRDLHLQALQHLGVEASARAELPQVLLQFFQRSLDPPLQLRAVKGVVLAGFPDRDGVCEVPGLFAAPAGEMGFVWAAVAREGRAAGEGAGGSEVEGGRCSGMEGRTGRFHAVGVDEKG